MPTEYEEMQEKLRGIKDLPEEQQKEATQEIVDLMFGQVEELHPDLEPWVEETENLGRWIKHPLVFSALHLPQFNANVNRMYTQRSQAIEEMWEEENYKGIVWAHERAYRMEAFLDVHEHMNDHDYWETLGAIWTDSENIWQNEQYWVDALHSEREGREYMMEPDEREALAKLPEVIKIYRGYDQEDREYGLSWTLDKERAEWFARRLWFEDKGGVGPSLAEGEVKREHVIAYFTGRKEAEIVVASENIENMKVTALQVKGS
jgi:hypothetical protein